jgi:hypothetical protein
MMKNCTQKDIDKKYATQNFFKKNVHRRKNIHVDTVSVRGASGITTGRRGPWMTFNNKQKKLI